MANAVQVNAASDQHHSSTEGMHYANSKQSLKKAIIIDFTRYGILYMMSLCYVDHLLRYDNDQLLSY